MNRSAALRAATAALCSVVVIGGALPAAAGDAGRDAVAPAAVPPVAQDVVEEAPLRLGEVLVKPRPGITTLPQAALLRAGGRVVGHRRGGWQVVAIVPGREHLAAQRLAADRSVAEAVPNFMRTAASHSDDELGWGVRSLRAPEVWDLTPPVTGAGVRVAVLDSGVDANHPQLVGRVAPGFDVFGGRGRDDCGHGTAVAGVIGAAHDRSDTVGVAPDVTIVPVKVLRFEDFFGACVGDDEAIAQGIMWAADPAGGRADVINLSLSGPPPSQVLADAVAYAARQGVLVVAAAGNAGDRVPNYPAAYPEVVSVGALQPTVSGVAWWPMSTFGSVDIAAPGSGVPVILAQQVTAQRLGARPCTIGRTQQLCADGTSFAAPHVAGMAALLRQVHPELATVSPSARLSRLRQWILGTATDIAPQSDQWGVDLKTGHGRPDAVAAVATSADEAAVLLTWEVGERVLSPSSRMAVPSAAIRAALVVSTGTGEPLANRAVSFRPEAGGMLSVANALTDRNGRAATVFTSTAGGQRTRVVASVGNRVLPLESYVLQRDDNVPGVALPASPFRGRLDLAYDVDDVHRVRLKAGETMRVNITHVDPQREYFDMYLHGGGTRDVTNPERAPLRENTHAFELDPLRLRRTVASDGTRYVHVLGYGGYRAKWSILSPGKVRRAAVAPSTITPNGDGRADTARVTWRTARSGDVTLRIRDSRGRVVRAVRFGVIARGSQAYVWNGRTSTGRVAAAGVYKATLHWANGKGRVASTTAKVRLSR